MARAPLFTVSLVTFGLLGFFVTSAPVAAQLDADALLSHVRESQRAGLAAELGVGSLSELPGYDLHLSIAEDMHGFGLREVVEVLNDESAPMTDVVLRIFVNATPPEHLGPQVRLIGGRCLDGLSCEIVESAPTIITVTPAAPLAPGARARIELDLTGHLEAIDPSRTGLLAQGFEGMSAFESGASSHGYGLLAQDGTTATLAAFFPVLARRAAGRWITDDRGTTGDLGTDRMANVRARVVVPHPFVVAATGEASRRRSVREPDGRTVRDEVTIDAAAIRDFALVVGPTLETLERNVGGVTVRSVFVPAHRDAGTLVLGYAAAALEIFQRRFGPYPYTALDVVEAPLVGGAGGVEFSSLVTVASMFYGGSDEGLGQLMGMLGSFGGGGAMPGADLTGAMLEFVTAHEVAHQWWHGIVGSDSREHPVTDESLAQWSSVLYMEERYGAERAATEAERQVALNYVMMRVNDFPDAAADQPASAFDPAVTYAGIVYGKAPFLWIRLRERLGDAAFFAGIATYVSTYRMREAPPDGLLEILASAADRRTAREVRRLGRRYLHERHGDEDLGPIDEERMMTSMLGPAAAGADNGMMRAVMRMLMRGGAGGMGDLGDLGELGGNAEGLGALLGGLGEGGETDPEELRRALGGMMGDLDPSAATEMLEGMDSTGGGSESAPSGGGPTRLGP